MSITTLPASPAGEITHNDVRQKVNEVIVAVNKSESIVYVTGDDDLPPLSGLYSELAAGTLYWFQNNITITKPLLVNVDGVTLYGTSPFGQGVSFTGTLPFLTSTGVSVTWLNLSVTSNTASEIFNCTGTATNTFYAVAMNLEGSSKIGTFNGISPVFRDLVAVNFSDGMTFSSSASIIRGISFKGGFMVDDNVSNAVHFDYADALFLDFEVVDVIMDTAAGANTPTCFSSSVGGSGNIFAGIEADVSGCTFGNLQPMTPLVGFTDDWQTNQFNFSRNSPLSGAGVESTKYEFDQYLLTTNTVSVVNAGEFYEIGTPASGSFQSDIAKHFTSNADGTWTYTGDKPIDVDITYIVTVDNVGGGQDEILGRIAINWSGLPSDGGIEKSGGITQNNAPTQIAIKAKTTLSPMDNGRSIYSNQDDTSDINIVSLNLTISESK